MNPSIRLLSPALLAALALVAPRLSARAQIPWADEYFQREFKVDVYGIGEYLHQYDTTFSDAFNGKYKLKLDDTGLGGLGVAYHFNDFIAAHIDFLLGPATFRTQAPGGPSYTLGDNGFIQSGRLNLDYNIINRRLTPFITAGIGYQFFQVDQSSDYYYSYYDETDFTWNVGAGLRWNITDNLFIKATGGAQWLKYEGADNITTQIEAAFAIGCTFP